MKRLLPRRRRRPRTTKPTPKPAVADATPLPSHSAARTAAVAAIESPATGDAFEDGYNYGYRLWEAKFYPEAQVTLDETITKYPKHKRASYARNLLGRAWLDDKKPATAVKIFYDNYKTDPRGERAPESLFFLGSALTDLDKTAEACEAFGELAKAYPDAATGRLADRVDAGQNPGEVQITPSPEYLARFRTALGNLGGGDDDRIMLAVSGGPDSLALLLLAHEAVPDRIVCRDGRPSASARGSRRSGIVRDIVREALGVAHTHLDARKADHRQYPVSGTCGTL